MTASVSLVFALLAADTLRCPDTLQAEVGPVYPEAQVHAPVAPLETVAPWHPPGRGAGIVLIRYVVGTGGCVEPGSMEVLAAPDSLFAEAARDALRRSRFRPAVRAGVAVRQRVEQRIRFRGNPPPVPGRPRYHRPRFGQTGPMDRRAPAA